jgi:hypothetical protein
LDIYSFGACIWECLSYSYIPEPKPLNDLQLVDNNEDDIVLLPFPVKDYLLTPTTTTTEQLQQHKLLLITASNKKTFSLLERTALRCLLWDYKRRPNATIVSQLLTGTNVASILNDVDVTLLSTWDDTDDNDEYDNNMNTDIEVPGENQRRNDTVQYYEDIQIDNDNNTDNAVLVVPDRPIKPFVVNDTNIQPQQQQQEQQHDDGPILPGTGVEDTGTSIDISIYNNLPNKPTITSASNEHGKVTNNTPSTDFVLPAPDLLQVHSAS